METDSPKRMGGNLDNLLGRGKRPAAKRQSTKLLPNGDKYLNLPIDQISKGPYQPRKMFDQERLLELADSLKSQGLIQPILVRPVGDIFELVAGERRWRAARLAGMSEIPAIVRVYEDQDMASTALIENVQRQDLNPLEEAEAFNLLRTEFGMTHESIAESVGRSRSSVTNTLRLLELHTDARDLLAIGKIDMGHARALLSAPYDDQPEIAKQIAQKNLTVRAVENLTRKIKRGDGVALTPSEPDPDLMQIESMLSRKLSAKVSVQRKETGTTQVGITFKSHDEFETFVKIIADRV